jgi:hypothetical protein
MKKTHLTLVGVLTAFFCLNAGQVLGITVYGEIFVKGRGLEPMEFPFQAALDAKQQQWQVKVTYEHNNTTNYQEICGSDGEKTCDILKYSKEKLVHDIGRAGATEVFPQAYIIDGTFPGLSIETSTEVIWLAFGSASFFRESTSPLPALWTYGFNNPASYGEKIDRIEFLEPTGRLPSKIDFVFSTNQLLTTTNFPFLNVSMRNQRVIQACVRENQQYDGKLDAEYIVSSTTNFDGMLLPLTFKYEFFTSGPNNKPVPVETFLGKVSRVTSETPSSFLPDIAEGLWTRDYRFSDARHRLDNISYNLTNRFWPSTNDAALQDIFKRKISHLPPLPDQTKSGVGLKTRLLQGFLLLTVLIFPVIILLSKSHKEKTP